MVGELELQGILAVTMNNQKVLTVKKDVFKANVLGDERGAIYLLRRHDIFLIDADCKNTRQIPVSGGYLSRRYYLKRGSLRAFLS